MVYSASSMWAANAATVTPSSDTEDGKVHFTVANLMTNAHRAIEAQATALCLRTIFSDKNHFVVHDALPSLPKFGDEGAANHNRLCCSYGDPGIGMFVYGGAGSSRKRGTALPDKFPARQSLDASRAVARQHGVLKKAVFVQQNPMAIDAGAFHNDVVAVANGPVLFHHELAFVPGDFKVAKIALGNPGGKPLQDNMSLQDIVVDNKDVSLSDAIQSYLFNSQLLASPDGSMEQMHLLAPSECKDKPAVKRFLDQLVEDTSQPIRRITYVNVGQSMSNGGGPACLRLRVVLNEAELLATNHEFLLDEDRIDQLETWVTRHYRDQLAVDDLADPLLLEESRCALDELSQILALGSIYAFQR